MEENKLLLKVKDLKVSFFTPAGEVKAVDGISYSLGYNEVMGVVGESGSGKSVEAYSIIGLLQNPGKVIGGSIEFEGEDLLSYTPEQMRQFRGNKVSMIFQNPMTCLNPVYTIGNQLTEALTCHDRTISKEEARRKAIEMLELVGINNAEKRMNQYPHEFSGGMLQRALIAMALVCNPKLLIADEPTTALDPTIQAQIIQLLKQIREKMNMGIMYITHDLSVVAQICDRVVVMYAGMVQEIADVRTLFHDPRHPYTLGLMQAMPKMGQNRQRLYNIDGIVPHITQMPEGCHFAPRCPYATEECHATCPGLTEVAPGHFVRCHHHACVKKEE